MARGFLESKTLEFKTYCFEAYKSKYRMNGRECLALFKKYKIFSYLDDFYDVLHTRVWNTFSMISTYISRREEKANNAKSSPIGC